jgi:hypothetical protein
MRVYIPDISEHAGHWIFKGYKNAWKKLGYETVSYKKPTDIDCDDPYMLMVNDTFLATHPQSLKAVEKSVKSFIQAQPNTFPQPWGGHPNFVSLAPDDMIGALNEMENVFLWSFADKGVFHPKWKEVYTIPLAYDSVDYTPIRDKAVKYDVCYVGGWANNGFNEKKKILIENFMHFKKGGLNCGFFVNRGISHQQEIAILHNSKVCINIHDAYQRTLGLDTNERTFKSLGLNGMMISDEIEQLHRLFPNVRTSNNPAELVEIAEEIVSLSEKETADIKEENRQLIMKKHTYIKRVEQLLLL